MYECGIFISIDSPISFFIFYWEPITDKLQTMCPAAIGSQLKMKKEMDESIKMKIPHSYISEWIYKNEQGELF